MLLQLKKYYQQRKSHKAVSVYLQGNKVPLYGAGASLAGSMDNGGVPMMLDFEVESRGNVVGKLVMSTHRQQVFCSVTLYPHSNKPIELKENACKYD